MEVDGLKGKSGTSDRRTALSDDLREQAAAEKRYLTAMGGEYAEVDVVSRPLLAGKDFGDRISSWLKEVKDAGAEERALVVFFPAVKEGLSKQGVDFNSVIGSVCQKWVSSTLSEAKSLNANLKRPDWVFR